VPSVDVFLGLSKEFGFSGVGLFTNKKVDVINECLEGLFWEIMRSW